MKPLRRLLNLIYGAADPEDREAREELEQRSPTNTELRKWAEAASVPPGIADEPEERPW